MVIISPKVTHFVFKFHFVVFFPFLYPVLSNNASHWFYAVVFKKFNDELESFNSICEVKAKGILSLYKTSFLAREGESFLDEARHFAIQHLSKYLKSSGDEIICTMVRHALELPLHWRMPRLEVRWFIDLYRRKLKSNPVLLDLATLGFNIVQSTHQDDLKYASR